MVMYKFLDKYRKEFWSSNILESYGTSWKPEKVKVHKLHICTGLLLQSCRFVILPMFIFVVVVLFFGCVFLLLFFFQKKKKK